MKDGFGNKQNDEGHEDAGGSHGQLHRSTESFNKGTTGTGDTTVKTGKYFIANTRVFIKYPSYTTQTQWKRVQQE